MSPQNEFYYAVSLHVLNQLLVLERITPAEYRTAKTRLLRKCQPVVGSLQEEDTASETYTKGGSFPAH